MAPNLTSGSKYLLEQPKCITEGGSDPKRKLYGQREGKEEETALFYLKDNPRYNFGSMGVIWKCKDGQNINTEN